LDISPGPRAEWDFNPPDTSAVRHTQSVLSAAGASLPAGPQLYTSTDLHASGGPVRRQHRQTIEPTGAEPIAGTAGQSTTASILSTAAALLKDVRAPAT
jgi:hypothetical protein